MFVLSLFFLWSATACFAEVPSPSQPTTLNGDSVKGSDLKEGDAATEKADSNQTVGEDLKLFGEQVAKRVDRVIRKKGFELWGDPWMFQGIPIILPSPRTGFNLGVKIQVQNIRRQDPHQIELEGQILASDRGRYKHSFRVDLPHAFNGLFRLTGRVAYDRDISFRYFGISNNTSPDPKLVALDSVLFQNTRSGPSFTLSAMRYLNRRVRTGPILGLKWSEITAPAGSLLLSEKPTGIGGGRTHYLGWAIIHDTLDFEPYPSRGAAHELFLYLYRPWTGSSYSFTRSTYTYRRYFLLHKRLILAHRTFFEVLSGDVPFFEMGVTGGSNPTIAFGGDRFFRGYESNRFLDHIRFATGFEFRWDPIFFDFAGQDLTLGFVPFVDLGRVWPTVFPLDISRFHASTGWGARLIWNNRFVVRMDFAVNPEGTAFIVNLGNSF